MVNVGILAPSFYRNPDEITEFGYFAPLQNRLRNA